MDRSHLVTASGGATFLCGVLAVGAGEPLVAVLAGLLAVATAVLAYWATNGADEPDHGARDGRVADPLMGEGSGHSPIRDAESGLYGTDFFHATLDGRVATARRVLRPLSIIVFAVEERTGDGFVVPVVPSAIRASLRVTLRESDIACRVGQAYGVLLEDTGEDGAVWTAERLRRNLADTGPPRLFRAGVASYPTHGLTARELVDRADAALRLARDWHRDRIEVAPTA